MTIKEWNSVVTNHGARKDKEKVAPQESHMSVVVWKKWWREKSLEKKNESNGWKKLKGMKKPKKKRNLFFLCFFLHITHG